jgi:GNAT superfamily N-acetyltransferase
MITTQPTNVIKETDKNGNSVLVKTIPRIGGSEIYSFFIRQMADLIDSGHSNPVTTWTDNDGAVYVTDEDGRILGHIVYQHHKEKAMLWITLSAVDEAYRGRGLYKILHKYLEKVAKHLECTTIQSTVHVNNDVRLASAKSVGLNPQFYLMCQQL